MDTMDSRIVSSDGNHYTHVFANKSMCIIMYPMDKKSKAGGILRVFTTFHMGGQKIYQS